MEKTKHSVVSGLRWLEKYTRRTDMVYLAKGGSWLSLKTVLTAAMALGLSVAFANLVPQHVFGEYKYVFSIFGLLAIPTLLGMSIAVTKSVAQGYEGTPAAALRVKMKWGVIGSVASVAIALYYYIQGNTGLAEHLPSLLCFSHSLTHSTSSMQLSLVNNFSEFLRYTSWLYRLFPFQLFSLPSSLPTIYSSFFSAILVVTLLRVSSHSVWS